ncbi:MAG: sensor histidine kinase, partial [Bacteriovoracaceae bacterium]|nr:sensor histidine kinase [Bacteriovoracaceae bacterium]
MRHGDLINLDQCCQILDISRATLTSYRKKYEVSSFKIKQTVFIPKLELLNKIYTIITPLPPKVALMMDGADDFEQIKIDATTYDLRRLDIVDGHGAISLLSHLLSEIRSGSYLHLIIGRDNSFLKAMNLFGELKRHHNSNIFWDEEIFNSIPIVPYSNLIKLPITRVGVVGGQNRFVDDLSIQLSRQGYSIDVCSYIGWAIGELADNSATHAKTHPCFIYFEQFGDDQKYLQLTIGDTGIGIPESLAQNSRYSDLSTEQALLNAFRPYVSGRCDEEKRGKGLADVLQIAMECGSRMRVESNGIGYSYTFDSGIDRFQKISPLYRGNGTIISLLFIDGLFGDLTRDDV